MSAIYVHDLEQGSDEWLRARLGIATASRFDSIITPAKGEPSTSAKGYLNELLAEWLSGEPLESFQSAWMERGNLIEPEARNYYAFERELDVVRVGFVYANEHRLIGCSPDGLIGDDGLIEIKCPKPATHVGYLLGGKLPMDYRPQVQGSLYVTGRAWCDFVSYAPGLPALLVRVERDEEYIKKLRDALETFASKIIDGRNQLAALGYQQQAA